MSGFAVEFAGCVWTEDVGRKKNFADSKISGYVRTGPKTTTTTMTTRTSTNKRFTEQNKAVHVRF